MQCVEGLFEKGENIVYQLGGRKSGGKGGKGCGWFGGNGNNGAGASWAKSSKFYIIAGGGGGNSQSGNKGGDYEKSGKGKFHGDGATEETFGKGGDRGVPDENGEEGRGGNSRRSGWLEMI